ncbi:MAG TPA: arsenate reductase ArsC [Bacteroidia bacterium]|nr:arsenate reductase ArsC [Bacteroidia bacterium]
MKNILVLCTGNSCRSQIAEGYLRTYAGDRLNVYSAGVEKHGVNPLAVEIMAEAGIDISGQTSNLADEYTGIQFDYIITVCDNANERCPYFPGTAKRLHHNFPDPAKATGTREEIRSAFRKTRNLIDAWIRDFTATEL